MELKFEECFVLTDLFGDDTTGFVKVSLVSFTSGDSALNSITDVVHQFI